MIISPGVLSPKQDMFKINEREKKQGEQIRVCSAAKEICKSIE